MQFIRKIAIMGLPLATALVSATAAYADPCLSLTSCAQQQVQQGVENTRNAVKTDTNQFSSNLKNARQSAQDQAKVRWNNASDATRQKWEAQRNKVTNAEQNAKDKWNNASEETRKKWEAQGNKVT
ncbi:MAG: hypothetical protein ABF513_00135, partial [Acetobacter malorum]